MKRLISMLVVFVLLLTVVTFSAAATEIETSGYDSLVAKAVAAFPEYAAKMQNPAPLASTYSYNSSPRELLISETRAISDKEFITYSEYSDGLILLSGYDFVAEVIDSTRDPHTTYTDITIDIEATCVNDTTYKGYFYLDGVKYSLRSSDFDSIINIGTARQEGLCTKATLFINNPNETLTSYAELGYQLDFQIGPGGYYTVDSVLILYVGEDTAILQHIDHNDYV